MTLRRGQKLLVILWAVAVAATLLFPWTTFVKHSPSTKYSEVVSEGWTPIFLSANELGIRRARRYVELPQVFLQFGAVTVAFGTLLFLSYARPKGRKDGATEEAPNQPTHSGQGED